MSDIKEDIKILKELANAKTTDLFGEIIPLLRSKYIIALENILNRLEQDERVIEEMAISMYDNYLFGLCTVEEIIDDYRKQCE